MDQAVEPDPAVEPASAPSADTPAGAAKGVGALGVAAGLAAAGAAAATVGALNPNLPATLGETLSPLLPPTRPNLPGSPDPGPPLSVYDAARFLTQATFGPNEEQLETVRRIGTASWLFEQTYMPVSGSHRAWCDARLLQMQATNPSASLSATQFYESFWQQAATGLDQLRQRVKFALSEIFVISLNDAAVDVRGAASYYDMLGESCFENFRTLLERVTLHPMMGRYLTHLANQKEDLNTGRKPDENYAREVMQLMTIGLHRLNADGTVQTDGSGQPIPTYTSNDISELAKVLTGFSWYHPTPTNSTFFGGSRHVDASIRPMIGYPQYHSVSQKSFLGVTIPAGPNNAAADLALALDTLFNHPNTGPFIAKQLIQRLVTSNPSPAYVQRVAAAFAANGQGQRGDMRAVITAVLSDGEARQFSWAASHPSFGKLREPVIRLANWMRAFGAASVSGNWLIGSTSATTSLGQSALTAPSVFNFFRPGYVPPNTQVGGAGLVAPEFQGVDEVSVAGYLNTMQAVVGSGVGTGNDVRAGYFAEIQLARDPAALASRMNTLFCCGHMSTGLRSRMESAIASVAIPAPTGTNQAAIDTALSNRAKLAIFLTLASPDYLIQR